MSHRVIVSKQLASLLGWNPGQANTFDVVMDGVRLYINAKHLLVFDKQGEAIIVRDGALGEVCPGPKPLRPSNLAAAVRKHTKPEGAKVAAYTVDDEPMSEAEFAEFVAVNSGQRDPSVEPLDDREIAALKRLRPGMVMRLGGGAGAEVLVKRLV